MDSKQIQWDAMTREQREAILDRANLPFELSAHKWHGLSEVTKDAIYNMNWARCLELAR